MVRACSPRRAAPGPAELLDARAPRAPGTLDATKLAMRSSLIVPALLVALTAACVTSNDDRGLGAARARWAEQRLSSYRITSQTGCFCGSDFVAPIRLVVVADKVTAASYVADQRAVSDTILRNQLTVEDAFDKIQDALDRKAVDLQVTYDPQLGYPRSIQIDYSKMIADEEWSLKLSDLAP
jgi:hypothetical protein